jgi:hypothetical protein
MVFEHAHRFIHPGNGQNLPHRTLVIISRESGIGLDIPTQMITNILYALRYVNATPHVVFDRLVVQHIRNRSSRLAVPDQAVGAVDVVWGDFLRAMNGLPISTSVDFLVRGWDGLTSQTYGLRNFILRYGSGPQCMQGGRRLNFRFVFFQPRESTGAVLQWLFGDPAAPNAPAGPGPSNLWWPQPPPNHPGRVLEHSMRARVHPPFTHQQYLNMLNIFHTQGSVQAARNANSTLALWYVLAEIDRVKTAGGVPPQQQNFDPHFNRNRNSFLW